MTMGPDGSVCARRGAASATTTISAAIAETAEKRTFIPGTQIIIRSVRVHVAAGLLARLVCVPIAAHADTSDRLSKTVPLPPGRAIRIEATVADLSIVGSDRADLAVEIVRRAPSAGDLAKYPVVIDDNPSALRIAVSQAEAGRDPALKTDIAIA